MKTIIAGSRTLTDIAHVQRAISDSGFEITEVVSGKARGADTLGEMMARRLRLPVKEFPADWSKGPSAGPIRNRQMSDYAEALILVWDGESKGSANMLQEAKKRGLRIHQHLIR
jgi:hypothetical protein